EARRRAKGRPTTNDELPTAVRGGEEARSSLVVGRSSLVAHEGTVTFLFTDIEGSTRLWEEHPEAMRAALARHDALAAADIAEHGGTLLKSRGEGDSLFAVFARASEAVSAACALQRAFLTEPWPTPTPLRVRIALHTGEAELREGDY